MSGAIDWAALCALGLGRLRLAPEVFWAMTPFEFDCAARGATGVLAAPMDRAGLARLMALHPDREEDDLHE